MTDIATQPDDHSHLGDPNQNFFYLLATAYGELPTDAFLFDGWLKSEHRKLADKNLSIWNRWWWAWLKAKGLDQDFLDKFKPQDQEPLSLDQWTQLKERFAESEQDYSCNPSDWFQITSIDLEKLLFRKPCFFAGFQFVIDVSGLRSKWQHQLDCRNAHFSENALFLNAQFGGDARFSDAQFSGNAWFGDAQFIGVALFYDAKFSGITMFSGAQFSGDISFRYAHFKADWSLRNAGFNPGSSLYAQQIVAEALVDISWQSASPSAEIPAMNFTNATFKAGLQLKGRRFATVPQFQGATLNANFAVNEDPAAWPKADPNNPEEDHDSYEHLRAQMAAHGRRGLELFFLGKEYDARIAKLRRSLGRKLKFSQAYWLLSSYRFSSDYGRQMLKPLGFLALFWFASLSCYVCWLAATDISFIWGLELEKMTDKGPVARLANACEKLFLAGHLAFSGLVSVVQPPRFTVANGDYFQYGWILGLHGFQRLVSAVLWFLFGLSVRNRLRLGG